MGTFVVSWELAVEISLRLERVKGRGTVLLLTGGRTLCEPFGERSAHDRWFPFSSGLSQAPLQHPVIFPLQCGEVWGVCSIVLASVRGSSDAYCFVFMNQSSSKDLTAFCVFIL